MNLGAFSISLTVKNGTTVLDGNPILVDQHV